MCSSSSTSIKGEIMKKLVFAFILVLLSACVNMNDPKAVGERIKTEHDDFAKVTHYTGPEIYGNGSILLRAWKPDNGKMSYQIYAATHYHGQWHYYSTAFDSNGTKLDATQISRHVVMCSNGDCSYDEDVALNITREYLDAAKEKGLSFKIMGTGGEEVYAITPAYIQAFLSATK